MDGKNTSSSKLLKIAEQTLPREKFDELEKLYQETTVKDPKLVEATIAQMHKMKKPWVAELLSIIGLFGVDRFYIGDKRTGITKLCTLGGLLVFWFYDMFNIIKRTKYLNYINLRKAMGVEIEEFDLDKLNKGEN